MNSTFACCTRIFLLPPLNDAFDFLEGCSDLESRPGWGDEGMGYGGSRILLIAPLFFCCNKNRSVVVILAPMQ